MTFWEKFRKLVSYKHLYFGIGLFALVIAMAIFETGHKVSVDFMQEDIRIYSSKYTMTVPYALIDSAQLLPLPEAGAVIDGFDDMSVRTGLWNNAEWGDYTICADLKAANCIALQLKDGRIFVFSSKNDAATEALFQTLLQTLN